MAAVVVSVDNDRIENADTTTGWLNLTGGGGIAIESDIVYQGVAAASRKVSTSFIGRGWEGGAGTDMTAANRSHYIAKINATNFSALQARSTPTMTVRIGSGTAAYQEYYVFGNENYPTRGGWQILPINPNITGYIDVDNSPTLTGIDFFGIMGDFSATSKAENLVIDAIDIGTGLYLVGGDGGDTDGTFQDFVDRDEGNSSARFGYVATEGPILLVNGLLAIGQDSGSTSTATEFSDTATTVVWQNGYAGTEFHKLLIDLDTSGTAVTFTQDTLVSLGKRNNDADRDYNTSEDTRTYLEVTGNTGTFTAAGSSFTNFSNLELNDGCSFTDSIITSSGRVFTGPSGQGGATLTGSSILTSAVDTDEGAVVWNSAADPSGELDGMTFSIGSNLHHMLDLGVSSPISMTLTDWTVTGANSANEENDSTFLVRRTSGTVTINISNGTGNFSYKTLGAEVVIVQDPVTTLVTTTLSNGAPLASTRVMLKASDATGPLPFEESVTISRPDADARANVVHTAHGLVNNDYAVIAGADQEDYNGIFLVSNVTTNSYEYGVLNSPTTPATGTIISTGAIISGTTDGSGEISDSRTWATAQPVTGFARKSSTTPFYKTAPINGTISTTDGLTATAVLISDE